MISLTLAEVVCSCVVYKDFNNIWQYFLQYVFDRLTHQFYFKKVDIRRTLSEFFVSVTTVEL